MPKSDIPKGVNVCEMWSGARAQSLEEDRRLMELYAAREDERRRVARELHDDLGQRIALLSIEAAETIHNIPAGFTSLTRQCQSLQSHILTLARDIRRVALEQHPATPFALGLRDALHELIVEYRKRTGLNVRFRATRVPERRIPAEATSHVYRIVQEALRNAAKHAGATLIEVKVVGASNCIRIGIRDFGKGFEPLGCRGHSLGLLNMQERAKLISGKFSLASRRGFGTRISLEVPLSNKEKSDEPSNRIDSR